MPMVDIHGCEWVWGNIIGAGDTGRRQGRPQMGTIGRGVHVGGHETDKKEGLVRRGKDGQRRQTRAHRACFKAYRPQIIKDRKGNSKKGNRAATRAKPNSASTHEKMHICNT